MWDPNSTSENKLWIVVDSCGMPCFLVVFLNFLSYLKDNLAKNSRTTCIQLPILAPHTSEGTPQGSYLSIFIISMELPKAFILRCKDLTKRCRRSPAACNADNKPRAERPPWWKANSEGLEHSPKLPIRWWKRWFQDIWWLRWWYVNDILRCRCRYILSIPVYPGFEKWHCWKI